MHEYRIIGSGSLLREASHALVLLHGRGGSPQDMLELARRFTDEDWHVAAPAATNGTWYPCGFMAPRHQNAPWLDSGIQVVHRLIEELHRDLPYDHIHIMGFSQGACLATEAAARHAQRYGGLFAFTGGLIGDVVQRAAYDGDFAGTPVYLSNSEDDPHVPLHRSKETLAVLDDMNARVTLDIFPGRPHLITEDEIRRVQDMITATVGRIGR